MTDALPTLPEFAKWLAQRGAPTLPEAIAQAELLEQYARIYAAHHGFNATVAVSTARALGQVAIFEVREREGFESLEREREDVEQEERERQFEESVPWGRE